MTGHRARPLTLTRAQILAARRRANALDERLPAGRRALRTAAWAGLQDSMPRAALLSLHARVRSVTPTTWEDPSLVQVWGPRFSAYVVADRDRATFTLSRLPEDERGRRRAEQMATRLRDHLAGGRARYGDVGEALGVDPNALRYGAATGTIQIRWEGARQPVVWSVPAPERDPADARRELARRYLRVFGPATADDFERWAGIARRAATATFSSLARELTPVRSPIGDGWILARDEPAFAESSSPSSSTPAPARLLPSGDAFFLSQGAQRELLVPDAAHRAELWTPRVWPGALLLDGEVRGTWRRANEIVDLRPWGRVSRAQRAAAEQEARALPLPGLTRAIEVRWAEELPRR